jgi:hypothetical protein
MRFDLRMFSVDSRGVVCLFKMVPSKWNTFVFSQYFNMKDYSNPSYSDK